jgi:parallel beta-helix repeat protein
VPAGTWTVPSALTFKTGQTLVGEYGAVISGGGTTGRATSASAAAVTLRNLTFRDFNAGYRNANVIIGSGWLVENVRVAYNAGVGISAADSTGSVIRDSIIDHNTQQGLAAYRSLDHLVENNEIAFNNTGFFDGGFEAGGGKWIRTSGLTVIGNYVHDNILSAGIWLDTDNVNATVSNNVIENNGRYGIHYEISHAGEISGNVVTGSARDGIRVIDSDNVIIKNNTVTGNGGGIVLGQDDRDAQGYVLRDTVVQANRITMCSGYTGARDFGGVQKPWDNNNYFAGNGYGVPNIAGTWWFWQERLRTWSGWQGLGQDSTSQLVAGC